MLQFPPAPLPVPAPAKGEYALFPGDPLLRLCNPEDEPYKGKMLKVDAVLLEQILEVNAAHKAAVFLGNSIFVKIGRSLTDEPLQFIVQCIRASLHRIECHRIVKQRALFCGQSVAVRQMVCNDFLDRFRCSFRVDFADSGHNKTLPFTFLFDELPVSYAHLHTMSIGILLFTAIFQQKVIRRVVFCTPVSYF